MMRIKRGLATVACVIAAAGGVVAAGTPAQAWVYCNNVSGVAPAGTPHWLYYPTYYTSGMGNADANCDMRFNETGTWGQREAIKQLQTTLRYCHLGGGWPGVDGEYGNETRNAVRTFQDWYNNNHGGEDLAEDGYAGPKTRSKMAHPSSGPYGPPCANPEVPIYVAYHTVERKRIYD